MKDSNPYVEARQEWNDRYLDLVRARRWWQLAAVAELVVVGLLSAGLVALSLQHKTVPYVVEVDALGAAIAVKPAEAGGRPTDGNQGLIVVATRKPRVSNRTLILRLLRTAARTSSLSLRQEPPRTTR